MDWPLLQVLSDDQRAHVLATARRIRFTRGETVFREREPGDCMHLVESGVFAVQVSAPSGELITVNVVAPGGFFGEFALLQETPLRTATVVALTQGETLTIGRTAFTDTVRNDAETNQLLISALVHRVDELSMRLLEALYDGVDRRVYRRLVDLTEIFSNGLSEVVLPISQDDLAAMAGASRPTVNQVLQKLVARGVVALGRRQTVVRDPDKLRQIARRA